MRLYRFSLGALALWAWVLTLLSIPLLISRRSLRELVGILKIFQSLPYIRRLVWNLCQIKQAAGSYRFWDHKSRQFRGWYSTAAAPSKGRRLEIAPRRHWCPYLFFSPSPFFSKSFDLFALPAVSYDPRWLNQEESTVFRSILLLNEPP